jgi:hypothetical protein
MIYNKFLLCVYLFFIIGCSDEDKFETKLLFSNYNPYDYWMKYEFIKNSYQVYNVINDSNVFTYEDTLEYIGDTLIAPVYGLYFNKYAFRKKTDFSQFIIGKGGDSQMDILFGRTQYPFFNLKLIQDSGDLRKISYDGYPFDDRFLVSYNSIFEQGYMSALGSHKIIKSSVIYSDKNNTGGKEYMKSDFVLAKNVGLVEMRLYYYCNGMYSLPDKSYQVLYKIKSVIQP